MEVVARVEAQSHRENSGCVTLNERGRGSNVICFERQSANDAFNTPTIARISRREWSHCLKSRTKKSRGIAGEFRRLTLSQFNETAKVWFLYEPLGCLIFTSASHEFLIN